ncbi:MAG: NUDIX domain-containing protein, partial [Gemmatimonadota bacterium]
MTREGVTVEGEYFRAGVGALIVDGSGRVLACERADVPGAWQLPQGGLRSGEDPLEGALREVEEETGVARGELELLDRHPEPLVYELPPEARSPKTGRGQVQYWFAF